MVMGTQPGGQQDVVLGTLTCEDAMAELGSATRITLLSPLLSRTPEQRWDHIWHRHRCTRQAGKGSRKTGEDGASPPHPCTGNLPDMGAKEGKRTAQGAGCTAGMLGAAQLEHPRQFLTASPTIISIFIKAPFPGGSPGSVTSCCARGSPPKSLRSWAQGLASSSPSLQRFHFLLCELLSFSRGYSPV